MDLQLELLALVNKLVDLELVDTLEHLVVDLEDNLMVVAYLEDNLMVAYLALVDPLLDHNLVVPLVVVPLPLVVVP